MNKALFEAITDEDDAEAIAPLLQEIEGRDEAGHSPLEHTFLKGATRCAEALLAAGAKPSVSRGVLEELYKDFEPGQYSPLGLAIYSGAKKAARCLIEAGAPPNDEEAGGARPIHLAASNGMTEVVAALLDHGVPVDVPYADSSMTAIVQAVSFSRHATVMLLVERGADRTVTNNGKTLEQMARRDEKMLAVLRGEKISLADFTDRTREVIAPYLGKIVTAALDGSLFAHRATTFHFFFDDPKRVRSFLREEYSDETRKWSWGEVVPVASVSFSADKRKSFSWLFLDWRGGKAEPAVVVTTTDRWSDEPRASSLAELHLAIGGDRDDDGDD